MAANAPRSMEASDTSTEPPLDAGSDIGTDIGGDAGESSSELTGSDAEIEGLAKRYRVAYQMEKHDPKGNYEVTHSSAVYVLDKAGHARLLATDHDSPDVIAHHLRRIIDAHS